MPQRIWALLPLLLFAFVTAGVKLASGATGSSTEHQALESSLFSPSSLKSDQEQQYSQAQRDQLTRSFEKRLLNMFGLSSRPRPKTNVTVSDYMWELYKKQNKLNRGLLGRPAVNTIRCFRGKEKKHSEPHRASYKFNLKTFPETEDVWMAELVVYRPPGSQLTSAQRVRIFDVLRPSKSGADPILRLVDTKVLRPKSSKGQWETFDVLPALHRWRSDPSSNHGVYIELSDAGGNSTAPQHLRLRRDVGESREQWQTYQPLLVTYSKDPSKAAAAASSSRTRRSPRKHRRKGRKDNCRRHALYVDFSDVGWNDWIVAPPGYDAYFCHGECPFPLADHLNSTNHAIVQTLVNSVNPAAVPRACCVPTELSPISMLYVDEYDKVVLKNYQDMVVEGCGCR